MITERDWKEHGYTRERLEEECVEAGLHVPSAPFRLNGVYDPTVVTYRGPDANFSPLLPEAPSRPSIASYAARLKRDGELGSTEWEDAEDPDFPLPEAPSPADPKYGACVGMRVPAGGHGHVQFHERATVGFLRCQYVECDDDFEEVREPSDKRRWPKFCSPECRADHKREADRTRSRSR